MSQQTLSPRVRQALEKHDIGYNCAQAVCCTFQDYVNIDEETLFRILEGFGLGMGGMDGTCGAISAAAALAGLKCSTGNLNRPDSKGISYQQTKQCLKAFQEKNGSVICRELKGVDSKKPLAPCNKCIADAVEIIEQYLFP